jgi:hypothetical protein
MKPDVDRLVEKYENVVIRRVDIVGPDSPAAKQAQTEFGMESIPYTRVYGPSGAFVAEIRGADVEAIEAAVRDARQR